MSETALVSADRVSDATVPTVPRHYDRVERAAALVGLVAIYFVAGKLGLQLAYLHPSATPIWAPTGIAIAACLLLGTWAWPAVLLGAFLVNITTAGTALTALGIATGNTLEALAGAWLVRRYASGRLAFDRANDVIRFAILAAALAPLISATVGVGALLAGGLATWNGAPPVWLTWWLGDAAGALVVAPVLVTWNANPLLRWNSARALEAAALATATLVTGTVVFGGLVPGIQPTYPLAILCMPLLIWAAFRFEQRGTALTLLAINAMAVAGTLSGHGPFARPARNEELLLLQGFVWVASLTTLTLAAVIAERRRLEARLRQLAGTDDLTGLANYRTLMTTLEREIRRTIRSGRPFAVLFLDVDRLKAINDSHGHLVGSRALRRVAEVLVKSCRMTDTPARYGGDEFAIVLPESHGDAARTVERRVHEWLITDQEEPRLSVSCGIAECPRDGTSIADLLAVADRAQYEAKRARYAAPRPAATDALTQH